MNRRQAIGLIGLSAGAYAQPATRNRFIGVWSLRSCLRTFKNGRTEYPFGEKPVGRIEYNEASRMSAILMRPGRRSTLPPGIELDKANEDELRDAVTGFVAYFGTFDIDDATQTVIHHVQASLSPSWVGTHLKRRFHFDDGHLILTHQVPESLDTLVWERAQD